VRISWRRPLVEEVTAEAIAELQRTVVSQAILLQRNSVELELWKRTAQKIGLELERVIDQPEGSEDRLKATWWRDQYAALTEQVEKHLAEFHPGLEGL